MRFYLGTHRPEFLSREDDFFIGKPYFDGVSLFVSAIRLRDRESPWPRSVTGYAIDSGGFSEIAAHGKWTVSPREYVKEINRWSEEIGEPDWCAPQDWMCEPHMLKKTGRSVRDHQNLTTANYHELRHVGHGINFIPVLQGWTLEDYLRHAEGYERTGVRLAKFPLVGVGSVCRRQNTSEAEEIIRAIARLGIRIHAFGFKIEGIKRCGDVLESADSMAWSRAARWAARPLPYCSGHKNCANCPIYALKWYREKIEPILSTSSKEELT